VLTFPAQGRGVLCRHAKHPPWLRLCY
jgi:hypothetical protein